MSHLYDISRLFNLNPDELVQRLVARDQDQARQMFTLLTSQQMGINRLDKRQSFSHFRKMPEFRAADIEYAMHEVRQQEALFDLSQRHNVKVQQHTKTIILRGKKLLDEEVLDPSRGNDIQETATSPNARHFPYLMEWLDGFAQVHGQGLVQRAMVVKLAPKSQVYPHADWGWYYLPRDRFHVVLYSRGSQMKCQQEESCWHSGEVWWFNNNVHHEAHNPSEDWRYHVIFDVLPFANEGLVEEIKPFIPYYRDLSRLQADAENGETHSASGN